MHRCCRDLGDGLVRALPVYGQPLEPTLSLAGPLGALWGQRPCSCSLGQLLPKDAPCLVLVPVAVFVCPGLSLCLPLSSSSPSCFSSL